MVGAEDGKRFGELVDDDKIILRISLRRKVKTQCFQPASAGASFRGIFANIVDKRLLDMVVMVEVEQKITIVIQTA